MLYFIIEDINLINFTVANIILLIICFALRWNKIKNDNKKMYWRERPKNLSVAIVNYYYKGKITKETIWLTLLDLISKGYYSLEKRNSKYYIYWKKDEMLNFDKYDLNSFEKEIVNYINVILIEKKSKIISLSDLKNAMSVDLELTVFIDKFYNLLKNEIKNKYGLIDKNKNYTFSFVVSYLYYLFVFSPKSIMGCVIGLIFSIIVVLISILFKNIKFGYKMMIEIVIILIVFLVIAIPFIPTIIKYNNPFLLILSLINPLLIIVSVLILKIKFYTNKQKELMDEVYGLKRFLNDFSLLSEKDLKYVELFKQYYALAVALEVKIEKIIPNNFEYDDNEFNTFNSMDFLDTVSDLIPSVIKFHV